MAHNLNQTKRGVAFAFDASNGLPWHGLGKAMRGKMTTAEAVKAGLIDYVVEKQPLIAFHSTKRELLKLRKRSKADEDAGREPPVFVNRKGVLLPQHYATVRTDTNDVLGVVGPGYHVVQNRDVFRFFDSWIDDDEAIIDTVGALGRGEVIFVVAKIPEEIEVTKGDPIDHYLVLTNSHDGSRAIQAFFSPIRVVCQNTLMAAMRGAKNVVSLKHTSGVEASLALAHRLLDTSKNYWNHIREAYAWMARKQMRTDDVTKFLAQMFPAKVEKSDEEDEDVDAVVARTKNLRETVLNLYEGYQAGAEKLGRTRWAMYNAMTQYIDHERKSRTGINSWQNSMFGGGAAQRQKSFDLLTDAMPREYDALVDANKN